MTLAAAFTALRDRLRALDELVQQLAITVDDAPQCDDEPAIVESMRAHASEIGHDVATALQSFERHASGDTAADCHEVVVRVWRAMQFELASYESIAELERVAAERGDAWRRWSAVVRQVLERCAHSVCETAEALADCWREAAERLHSPGGMTHV